jgi:HEAT repeat protein
MRRHSLLLLATACLAVLGQLPTRASDPKQVAADEQRLKAVNLKTDDAALLAFVRARTLSDDERTKIEALITQLGATAFRTREKATAELIAKGPVVMELLRQGINDPDLEVSRRCELCLQKIKERDVPGDVPAAVVRLLVARKTPGAVEALLAYLPFTDSETVSDEIRTALAELAVQDGKADKTLIAALKDKLAARRAAAGEALARAGAVGYKKAVEALLQDPDIHVRWRVAMALVLAKDANAVPPLIDLLVGTTQTQAWQIEDVLYRLAEGKESPPAVALGTDEASRKKCRDSWQAWWKENGKGIDLAVLGQKQRLLGYTTLVLLDQGRILEVDGNDNVRWQIDNVEFSLDVQVLPGDKVLIAEYHGNKVTERNFKGEVVWQHLFDGPQMAQRLPNGNTFIAGRYRIMEVDAGGKQVFLYHAPGGDGIMKCMKVNNGEVVCLFEDGKVARIDAKGKELSSFHVELGMKLFGGRIHALANGHVLIPHHAENKVVEYDSNGKDVWSVKIDQPIAAMRLPNGNTIVTSMNQNRAVEFDRAGKEVWQYRANTRVTRAIRR